MNTNQTFAAGILAGLFLASPILDAATMSASATAPVVNGLDISNFSSDNTDKWWNDNKTSGYTKGQTFTTGATPVLLKAVTFQTSTIAVATKGYTVRVGTVSGTTFTQIHSETATQSFTWNPGEYMTWTFATPIALAPNTLYGFDVGMNTSSTAWGTGIPYIYRNTGNPYAGGTRFMSGTGGGVGNDTMNNVGGDMVFHLDLQHPLNPSPDIGTQVPAGDLTLSWTNLAPTTGADVWVDVWFGTDAGSMTKIADKQQNLTSLLVNLPGANTYYWRIDSYLDGTPTGTPVTGSLFNFVVFDSDGDGFPDTYELLHTDPASATALNPGDDRDKDGLTNWVEFN